MSKPTVPEGVDLDLMAWDISDAIAKGDHGIDVGLGDIRPALPAFIAAILANAGAE